jgi:hypothetical protein
MEKSIPRLTNHAWQILPGTAIKAIGIVLMFLDHLYQMFLPQGAPHWLHWCGRPVSAMFLFLGAEGFFYTRNKKAYLLRLLLCSVGMSLGNILLSRSMPLEEVALINNIFGTLFTAAFYRWMTDLIREGMREKKTGRILLAVGGMFLSVLVGAAMLLALQSENRTAALVLMFIPNIISVEGGFLLVLLGLFFYLARNHRHVQIALVAILSVISLLGGGDVQWLSIAAIIPILLYNGQRGRGSKYFFYAFYPAHIYLLYIIAWLIRA